MVSIEKYTGELTEYLLEVIALVLGEHPRGDKPVGLPLDNPLRPLVEERVGGYAAGVVRLELVDCVEEAAARAARPLAPVFLVAFLCLCRVRGVLHDGVFHCGFLSVAEEAGKPPGTEKGDGRDTPVLCLAAFPTTSFARSVCQLNTGWIGLIVFSRSW